MLNLPQIKKSKVKNQNDKLKIKLLNTFLCIFDFCILPFYLLLLCHFALLFLLFTLLF